MELRLIVIDIDGTMTDGGIYYGDNGEEIKKFNTRDAAGIISAQAVGIDCMFLTGRQSLAVEKRALDLDVAYVYQGIKDKKAFMQEFLKEKNISTDVILYIGDDLNDLSCMRSVGHTACPLDAAEEVRSHCEYVSTKNGGDGAVRDIVFYYLRLLGKYDIAISKAYGGV